MNRLIISRCTQAIRIKSRTHAFFLPKFTHSYRELSFTTKFVIQGRQLIDSLNPSTKDKSDSWERVKLDKDEEKEPASYNQIMLLCTSIAVVTLVYLSQQSRDSLLSENEIKEEIIKPLNLGRLLFELCIRYYRDEILSEEFARRLCKTLQHIPNQGFGALDSILSENGKIENANFFTEIMEKLNVNKQLLQRTYSFLALSIVFQIVQISEKNDFHVPAKNLLKSGLLSILFNNILEGNNETAPSFKNAIMCTEALRLRIVNSIMRNSNLHDDIINDQKVMGKMNQILLESNDENMRSFVLRKYYQLLAQEITDPNMCQSRSQFHPSIHSFLNSVRLSEGKEINQEAKKLYNYLLATREEKMLILHIKEEMLKKPEGNTIGIIVPDHVKETLFIGFYAASRWILKYRSIPQKVVVAPLIAYLLYKSFILDSSSYFSDLYFPNFIKPNNNFAGYGKKEIRGDPKGYFLFYHTINTALHVSLFLFVLKKVEFLLLPTALVIIRRQCRQMLENYYVLEENILE
jgi:hypothetical protein